jgi:hypothetical protein
MSLSISRQERLWGRTNCKDLYRCNQHVVGRFDGDGEAEMAADGYGG